MEANTLASIRQQINSGDRHGAKVALVEMLGADHDRADAWALLAILLTHPAEQARCYREILRINPEDRQAELWLQALAGVRPLADEQGGQSCPRCGGMVKVSRLPGAPDSPVVCPYCGFHVRPQDAFPSDEDISDPKDSPEREDLDQFLKEISLPGEELVHPAREPAIPSRREERQGFLDGLVGRVRRGAAKSEAEALTVMPGEIPQAAGALSPELILRLAGGPLAPEERRNCPLCDAVVSRHEPRCPWCSGSLRDAENG